MSLAVLLKDSFGACILVINHLQHLIVDCLCSGLRVRTLELIFIVIIVANVRQAVAHTGVCHHSECRLSGTLEVVHGSSGYMTGEEFLSGASSEQ